MKAIRALMITASTEYENVNFIKVDIGSGHSTSKLSGGEKQQKEEPVLHGGGSTSHGNHALLAESVPTG
jgi:hypothetical protein